MTTTIQSAATTLRAPGVEFEFDEAQLAAVSFLARYSGRTLEAYRHDLRGFFNGPPTTASSCSGRIVRTSRCSAPGWRTAGSASTIDRRLHGLWVLPVRAHRRTYPLEPRPVRPPTAGPSLGRSGAGSLGARGVPVHRGQCDRDHAALAVLLGLNGLRVSEACATNIEDLGFGAAIAHCGSWARATSPPPCRSCPEPRGRSTWPSVNATRADPAARVTANASTGAPRIAGSVRSAAPVGAVHPHMLRAVPLAALDAGVPLRDVQIAARHADPRTTTIYDRRRQNFDRHAAYVVVAFVAGG